MMNCSSEEDEAEVNESVLMILRLLLLWERFISEIEAVCRRWMADGPRNLLEKGAVLVGTSNELYKTNCELKYDKKSYCMEYYFKEKRKGKVTNWDSTWHHLQLAFGVTEFLIIAPQSASGVVLNSPEASKLLSAVAIAMSNCCSLWPAFVPVHDPSRKAHIGIQNMGTVFTRRFESDCIKSQVPVKLMHLEGLYELFVSKFNLVLVPRVNCFKDYNGMMIALGVNGFELVTIWSDRTIESSLEMAEIENSSPHEAKMWHLLPIILDISNEGQKVKAVGFASQLSLLVVAMEMSFEAQFLEDFVSVDSRAEKLRSSASIPPPTVVARVLKELFHEGVDALDLFKGENKSSRAIKGAPAESLFAQFCLNSLWLGNCNIRESQPLPRIPINDTIDLSSCLIHQKLQMLAMCIEKKREANAEFFDATEDKDGVPNYMEEDLPSKPDSTRNMDKKTHRRKRRDDLNDTQEAVNDLNALDVASDRIRRGSAGVAGSMTLLSSCQKMHAPFTQDAPPMTEDIHDERLNAVAAFGDSFILHYLETLRPHQLLEQMVCTAFRASADTLNQASFGDLNQMKSKLDQFYLTMASMLRPLQANQLSQDSDIFEDLKRLCVIFEHVERLTVLAVSLYRKFILAPRLFNAIFSDYYNFYLPRMGKSEVEVDFHKEFDQRQQVWIDERNAVADLFVPPTSNQSWRKVLSMGNLLNGHEPVLREIIFTMCDDINDHHYATHNPLGPQQDIETYRMYIEGTSNDLGVSLSIVSCD
uniref:Rab3 GTPase-activating protein catalytic subunit n=1 Tax=Chenopodium quinoa TaxID=63459 RepID=A0A803MW87_CHEQI